MGKKEHEQEDTTFSACILGFFEKKGEHRDRYLAMLFRYFLMEHKPPLTIESINRVSMQLPILVCFTSEVVEGKDEQSSPPYFRNNYEQIKNLLNFAYGVSTCAREHRHESRRK